MPSNLVTKTAIMAAFSAVLCTWTATVLAAGAAPDWHCSVNKGQTQFDLKFPARVKYRYFSLGNPQRLVIDLDTALRPRQPSGSAAGCGVVETVRWADRKHDVLRYVLDLSGKAPVHIVPSPGATNDGFDLSVRLGTMHTGKSSGADSGKASARDAASPRPLLKTHPGKGPIVIAIDPGHGGSDPGTHGPHGLDEKTVTLAIARILAHKIESTPGLTAYLTRTRDRYVGLRKRVLEAQDHHAALFLSIHANAFPEVPSVKGGAVYALSEHGASSAEAGLLARTENAADPTIGSIHFASHNHWVNSALTHMAQTSSIAHGSELGKDILSHLDRYEPLYEHHVQYANFAVLRDPVIPSVLIETAFLSNPEQARELHHRKFREEIADAIYAGIREFLDHHDLSPVQLVRRQEKGNHGSPPPGFPRGSARGTYKVHRGDTLSGVAVHLHVNPWRLKVYNHLDSNRLRIGQLLKVPPASFKYTVQRGDTLSVIAEKANVSTRRLERYNGLDSKRLRAGQIIELPPSR